MQRRAVSNEGITILASIVNEQEVRPVVDEKDINKELAYFVW